MREDSPGHRGTWRLLIGLVGLFVSDSGDESDERTVSNGKRLTDPVDDSGSDISSDWSRGE